METMDTVRVFDTTLRDGEQSPGATLTRPEKLEIARLLESMGVDVIEAGFPISSNGDFEAVHAIASEIGNSVVCGLARCVPADIDRAGEAVRPAARKRIHVFCATSKIHREHKLKKGKEQIIQISVESVKQARQYTDDVEFSPEDASRTELDFLEEIVHAAVEAGATTVNLPDTVGYATPRTYGEIFSYLFSKLPILKQKKVILSCHCHDDLGLAVANSLAAIESGARQVECTINGIGERAGNAALEEIVMALRTRKDHFKIDTRIDATKIYSASRMVSTLTGLVVQRNKAIVGENAFAHEAGIHQDGILKKRETYEIMDPATIGIPATSLVLGKHSGRHAFAHKLEELGYRLAGNQLEDAFVRFKALADRKKHVYDEDIEALVDEEIATAQDHIKLVSLSVIAGTRGPQRATMKLDIDGKGAIEECDGNGPVDATFNCIKALVPHEAVLELYQVHAVTEGTDAQAEVSVRLFENGRSVTAKGADPDTLVASAKAYLAALNKLVARRLRNGMLEPLSPADRRIHSTDVG